jgi:hypothetical protein
MCLALLSDIITGIELQNDDDRSFLNIKTGAVETVSREEMGAAEEEKPLEHFPAWQQANIKAAVEILESDDYITLPSKFDVNEYGIMEEFCLSLGDDRLRDIMCNCIQGSGAFRRFKDNVRRFSLEENWYRYRDEGIRKIAVEWCKENGVRFVEKPINP